MKGDIGEQVSSILAGYDAAAPQAAAVELRALWLQFELKSIDVIKVEQRQQQETLGIASLSTYVRCILLGVFPSPIAKRVVKRVKKGRVS